MSKQGKFIVVFAAIIILASDVLFPSPVQAKTSFIDYFDRFGFEHKLSQGSPNCMVRGPQGYLWVGTQGGLNRFNGIEFKSYLADGSQNSLPGNWITGCAMDKQGNLWFATKSAGITQYIPHSDTFNTINQQNTAIISDDRFNSLTIDQHQNLWAGSADGALYRKSLTTGEIECFAGKVQSIGKINAIEIFSDNKVFLAASKGVFYLHNGNLVSVKERLKSDATIASEIWTLTSDQQGQLWIGAKTGLFKLSVTEDEYQLEKVALATGWVTAIEERQPGELWITTYGKGLFVYDVPTQSHQRFVVDNNNANSLKNNYLLSLFKDSKQQIWLGTDGKGLHRYSLTRNAFNHTTHKPDNTGSLSHAFVRAITKDQHGNLWVGTRGGLNKKAYEKSEFVTYTHQSSDTKSLPNNNVFALHTMQDNSVWVGTYGGGLARYQAEQDSFDRFTQDNGLPSNYIYAITSSGNNILWLGTNKGLVQFNTQTQDIQHYSHNKEIKHSLSQNTVVALLDDGPDTLWVATFLGLNRFDKNTKNFTRVQKGPEGLSDNMVTSLHKDNHGNLWIGTMNGLNRMNIDGSITQFGVEHGLPNANIFGIYQGDDDQLWISTNNGLAAFNYRTEQFSQFGVNDGVQDRSFILGAHFADADGTLYFGGVNGFNYFKPSELPHITESPNVVLEDFYLFNKKVELAKLNQRTSTENALSLSYSDSVFSIRFSAPKALYQDKVEYAYRLSGFDDNWLTADEKSRMATFTNIPAGEYQLQVKAKYPQGNWGQTNRLMIKVDSAPWLTLWAIAGYLLIFMLIIGGFIQLYRKKQKAEQDKQLADMLVTAKDELLANVSHEFKTPLTLILGPTNELLQTSQGRALQHLQGIKRNAKKLEVLVNNILNEKKVSSSELSFTTNISESSKRIVDDLLTLAHANDQLLTFNLVDDATIFVEVSPEKTELILINLVSNAVKYAGKSAKVQLKVQEMEQKCIITVSDNGVGIAPELQQKIFTRKFRASTTEANGHGLGLAIVKELVDEAGGVISLQSTLGQGASFTVELPIAYTLSMAETPQQLQLNDQSKNKKLLIIDDNDEIRRYLMQILSNDYLCQTSSNGKEGLELAKEWQPDVIVSDVMMPKMNGLELLQALRANPDISHIPVLMLSAYPSKSLKLKTLTLLADEFLPKPCSKEEVLAALTNILSIRAMSQQKAVQLIHQGEMLQVDNESDQADSAYSIKDKKFIDQLNLLLQQHHSDVEFTLPDLADALFMSERNLQIKTKALLGISPVDLLRDVRLHQASILLKESASSIGDIAQQSGFNSQSYFSKCFKDKYGVTPNTYRKKRESV